MEQLPAITWSHYKEMIYVVMLTRNTEDKSYVSTTFTFSKN